MPLDRARTCLLVLLVALLGSGCSAQPAPGAAPTPASQPAPAATSSLMQPQATQPPQAPGPANGGNEGGHSSGNQIVIHADGVATPIDTRLFGTNVPAWINPQRLANPAFQARTRALGTKLLRMPGGSWSNYYDWLGCETG
ncbi:MAG TPA: hypothetical protein VFT99_17175, partial [Roseiflexaceae bacterium]|nr:hypothetical protein [Roseiflexaceae bacterium]